MIPTHRWTGAGATVLLAFTTLNGCHREPAAAPADSSASQPQGKEEPTKEATAADSAEGVTLTAEQVAKTGIKTTAAPEAVYTGEVAGYGVVIPHDSIATAVAELATARAAQEQSRTAEARARRLVGTPGAMSADVVESAARQVRTDGAALELAQRRLTTVIGTGLADPLTQETALQDLASGKIKLLRATFPLGSLAGGVPAALRAARLDGAGTDAIAAPQGWSLRPVWTAPADVTLPGRSFFAILKADAGEGERLLVWAPGVGPSRRGAAVPSSALVLSGGKYWCYVEIKPAVFARREVAVDRPLPAGYFVTQGIAVGDKVVTSAPSLLLAREMNASTEAD